MNRQPIRNWSDDFSQPVSFAIVASICNLSATERARIHNFGVNSGVTRKGGVCHKASLSQPDFEQRGGQWVVTLWWDWLTEEVILSLGLNDRQRRVLAHLKTVGRIGNTEYQSFVGVVKRTAHRDLTDLVMKGVLEKTGTTGKGTAYVMRKGAVKGPKGHWLE